MVEVSLVSNLVVKQLGVAVEGVLVVLPRDFLRVTEGGHLMQNLAEPIVRVGQAPLQRVADDAVEGEAVFVVLLAALHERLPVG